MKTARACSVALGSAMAGCLSAPPDQVGSIYVKAVDVRAAEGAVIDVTAAESPELAGTRLVIPSGALAQDTRITVRLDRDPIVADPDVPAGPVAHFGPAGTSFAAKADLTLPYTLAAAESAKSLFVETLEDDGRSAAVERPALALDEPASRLTFAVSGFTRFQPGHRACSASHPCPAGSVCNNGRCQAPATALAFATAPQTVSSGSCSAVVTVESRDAAGNPASVVSTAAVALSASAAAGFAFYADAACSAAVAAVTIGAGASTASFYFRGTAAGAVAVTASAAGLASATQTETIAAAPAAKLVFTTPAQTLAVGACSSAAQVQVQDGGGNPVNASAAVPVALSSSSAGGTFYADATCAVPITNRTIAAGASTASFYYKDTRLGITTITASATGLASATQVETINQCPCVGLAFTTAPQTIAAGACSAITVVQSRDDFGNPANVSSATSVVLSATSPSFTFYADASCSTSTTGGTIPAGSSSMSFYFKGTSAGSVTVTASAAGLTSASQTETVANGPPAKLAFITAAQSPTAGACSAIAVVQSQDSFGNPANVSSATSVVLSATSPSFTFYADASCSTSTTGGTIPAGSSSMSFYFKGTSAGSVTVTASAAGLTSASQTETINNPAAPAKLVFLTAAQTVTAATCSAVATVQTQDSFGNPSNVSGATAVGLSSTSTGNTFYSDSTCATATTSVSIAAGTNTASFYFKDTRAGTPAITASATGLASATQVETINPCSCGARLAFTTAPQTVAAGACSAIAVVQSQDTFGNPANVSAATSVSLSATSTSFTFYADATCSTSTTGGTIPAGSSSMSFYFKGTSAGSVTVTASATGLTSASQTETVANGPPAKLAFITAAQSLTAGACSAIAVVQSQDTFGNPANVSAATSVSLSATSANFTFYADATCSTSIASRTIPAGTSSIGFYFRGTSVGSVTVTASSVGMTSASQIETVQ